MINRRKTLFMFGASALGLAQAAPAFAAEVSQAAGPRTGLADPLFSEPYVDVDEWRDKPVRHRYVHGGFKGTEARFSFYFPPKEQYQGRFFQHVTPVPISETLAQTPNGEDDKIGFSIASGGYFVETNEGGPGATAQVGVKVDPSYAGYRVNAAAAQYSRLVAAKIYGSHRPYGYVFGGSGGAYRTISGIENTVGVWDGSVPFVLGSPMAIPSMFTVRLHAMRVLKDKLPAIADAVEPGGGDMYAELNAEERAALLEVTRMGFPPRTWFAYEELGLGPLAVLFDGVAAIDPTYFRDFWTVPGYLGANPPESLLRARVQHRTSITQVITGDEAGKLGLPLQTKEAGQPAGGVSEAWRTLQAAQAHAPVALALADAPAGDLEGASLILKTGKAAGRTVPVWAWKGSTAVIRRGVGVAETLAAVQPGDELQVDNLNLLAIQTYHRHQVPSPDYYAWNQFRGPDGKPIYPQRPVLVGPIFARAAAGSIQTGRFQGKMITVASLMDEDALPWQADWYAGKVKQVLGARFDDNFRLWYTDHATHTDAVNLKHPTHVVSYVGILQQALRDLAAWVEHGVAPPASTRYRVVDSQIETPATAAERRGVQPVVTLSANGGARAEVRAGEEVTFRAVITAPPGGGKVVSAGWDFDGSGAFSVAETLAPTPAARVEVRRAHAFPKPGVHFVTLRATAQRQGDGRTLYARLHNLARARVVVS